jgi:RNA polymerase sigma-70 factor (sigma-E family)
MSASLSDAAAGPSPAGRSSAGRSSAEPPDPVDLVDLGPIYRDARPRLIRLAVLLVDDLATAEDIVQDVFVRLHRRGDAPIESIDGYLTTAVLNTARSTLRRRRVAAGGLLRLGARQDIDATGVDQADLTAEQARMWTAITELPTRQRQVVVCRYYLDLSERDTARTLGVSAGTVKTSASRAMKTLAQRLGASDE